MVNIDFLAQQVILWLGHQESQRADNVKSNEDLVFRLLVNLAAAVWNIPNPEQIEKFSAPDLVEYLEEHASNLQSWEAFAEWLAYPWHERFWVYQEYILSAQTILLTHFHYSDMKFIETAIPSVPSISVLGCAGIFRKYPSLLPGIFGRFIPSITNALRRFRYQLKTPFNRN